MRWHLQLLLSPSVLACTLQSLIWACAALMCKSAA